MKIFIDDDMSANVPDGFVQESTSRRSIFLIREGRVKAVCFGHGESAFSTATWLQGLMNFTTLHKDLQVSAEASRVERRTLRVLNETFGSEQFPMDPPPRLVKVN